MKIPIVPFDVAKDLKELGFDWPCLYFHLIDHKGNSFTQTCLKGFYDEDENISLTKNSNLLDNHGSTLNCEGYEFYSAPEQALVVKWLLETHNLFVQVTPHFKQWYWDILEINNDPDSLAVYRIPKSGKFVKVHNYPTHDDAQLEGIKECIKYLKNK